MKDKIGIIGGGSWGTAIAILLGKKGYDIDLWLRNEKQCDEMNKSRENVKYLPNIVIPSSVNITTDIEKTVSEKKIIVLAVPTHAVRDTLKNINSMVTEGQIIVNLAKGIENGSLSRVSEIVKKELPNADYVMLSGPSHAEEVAKDMPTAIVAACEKKDVAQYVQDVFMSPKFRVYTSPDVVGVELGGALKNVVALGAGISDGLEYGDNTKAALINRGIFEIARLGEKMGGDKMTFAGLSGIGDLIVTCTSMHSRNRRAGIKIGQGMSMEEAIESVGMVVEGIKTTKSAFELAKKMNVPMPITEAIYDVLYEGKDVKNCVINLMLRDKTHEIQDLVHKEDNDW